MEKNQKILVIFVMLFLFIVLCCVFLHGFMKYRKKREALENKNTEADQKLWALSFGGGDKNYHAAVNRIKTELENADIFDEIVIKTDIDLKQDREFWEQHQTFIETNKRGYGYWLWKPYLIMKTMEKMEDNDILFYVDSGCELPKEETTAMQIKDMVKRCNQNIILYTFSAFDEKLYNKMDLVVDLHSNNPSTMNSLQNAATLIAIKKTKLTSEFTKDWYTTCCNYHYIDDTASAIANDPAFVDHRHDQSVFSLLIKSDKYKSVMNTPTNPMDGLPFIMSRKRHG